MLFNSLSFFLFFPIVTLGYFVLHHRYRWIWLLAASCYFYMAYIPAYILILFFTIAVDYGAGILLEQAQTPARRKLILLLALAAQVGVLGVFKYANFLNSNLARVAALMHWRYPLGYLSLILPIGLSFHTFQSLAYIIEVYRGRQKAERHLGVLALFVMFYPQLVAGPIERPQNMLPQFREVHYFDYARVTAGLKLMLWGLFKKAVIADRLAVAVNHAYGNPQSFDGPALIVATLCFTYQIYCDFSGYSDMALGAAQVMGFRLMTNFGRPYAARSISEFWRRWHISLSTWFRDYLYIPLGGNRVPAWRRYFNLVFTFLVSGLWHGASWTFVLWGGLHGLYQVLGLWLAPLRRRLAAASGLTRLPRLHEGLQTAGTFGLVSFAWIFFRAEGTRDALYIAGHLTSGLGRALSSPAALRQSLAGLGLSGGEWLLAIAAVAILEGVQALQRSGSVRERMGRQPAWLRWGLYYGAILAVLFFGIFEGSQFIYFQF